MSDKSGKNLVKLSSGIDLSKCIICQKLKDNRGCKKLTSTESCRNKLFKCSDIVRDDLFQGLNQEIRVNIKYHVNTCYQRYVRNTERAKDRKHNLMTEEETELKE